MRSVETESGLQTAIQLDLKASGDEIEHIEDEKSLGGKKSIKSALGTVGKQKLKRICSVLKLLRYAGCKQKLMLFLSVVAAFLNGAITVIGLVSIFSPSFAIFIEEERRFYDNETKNTEDPDGDSDLLFHYGLDFFMLAAANMLNGVVQITLSERSSENIIAKIKTEYLSKLLSVNIGWYDKCEDQFVNTVSHDLQKIKGVFDSRMTLIIEIISIFIWGNIIGFWASAQVATVIFPIFLISIVIIYNLMQLSKRKARKQREYTNSVTKITSEVLGNARTVAAYGGENNEVARFEYAFRGSQKFGLRQASVLALARAFNYFFFSLCYAVAFYFSAWLYVNESFSPKYLIIVLLGQINVIYHLTNLLSTFSDLLLAMDSAYRVMSVLETETNYKSSMESGLRPKEFVGDIHFKEVVFSYPTDPQTKVLNELNLWVEPGKITAVVGKSGAGKSTIVGLVTRLYDPNFGQVLVDGTDVRDLNVSWLRNQIGVVMQEPTLFDATIEENIRFGNPEATREEIEAAARLSYAHDFIRKLPAGYGSVVGERGVKLSGGQKQRIAIARALVRKPKLLLLDEATSALDTRSEEIVQEALDNAVAGRTTVIIAHRMSTVRKAHRIYAMKDGVVVEEGSHEELMKKKGYYYSLVKTQELGEKDMAFRATSNKLSKKEILEEETVEEDEDEVDQDGVVEEEGSHEELMKKKGYYYSLVQTQELEEKDMASRATSNKLSKKEISEEETVEEDEDEVDQAKGDQEPIRWRLKNMNVYLMWIVAFIFCCLVAAFLPSFYFVFTLLCETLSHKKQDIEDLAQQNVLLVVYVAIISFLAVLGSGMSATKATQMWLGKVRRKAFSKVVSMDISWFDKRGNTPNETLEVLINSPALIESIAGDRIAQVFIFFLSIVFTLLFSLYISVSVTLVNITIILFFILINALRLRKKMSDAKSSKHITKSTKIAIEYVQNGKTIQLLNCQEYVIPQYEKLLELAKKENAKEVIFYSLVYGLTKALIRVAMGSTLVFGARSIVNGEVKGTQLLGTVMALSTASLMTGPSLVLMSQYPAARQALTKLYRIVRTRSALDVFSDQGLKPVIQGNIIFKDVDFSYPTRSKVQVLNELNLTIEAGKTIALVGNSGCGKTTIISLLERFYLPSGGEIIIDGININEINVGYLRKCMGLVSQEPVLFDLTVKDNILYGFREDVTEDRLIAAARVANIHDTIMKLPQGYDTMVGERGSKLSGGQKQRIAIARAVLRDPKILLLDEATSALDTESEKIVQEALEKASVGRTTIIIAHRLSTIRKADKIAVLDRGVVVEQGTHDELVAHRGHYYSLLHQS